MSRHAGADVLNNNVRASAYNRQLTTAVIHYAAQASGILTAMLGVEGRAMIYDKVEFRSDLLHKVSGDQYEVRLSGALPTLESLPTRASEVEFIDNDWDDNIIASSKFDLSLFYNSIKVPGSEVDQVQGDKKKGEDILKIHSKVTAEGIAQDLCRRLWLDNNQSRENLGGIPYMVDDSNTYCIDRSDASNDRFRSFVDSSGKTMARTLINNLQTEGAIASGKPGVIVCGKNAYKWLRFLIEEEIVPTTFHDNWSMFGGQKLRYGGEVIVLDPYMPTDAMYRLVPGEMCMVLGGGEKYSGNLEVDNFKYSEIHKHAWVAKVLFYIGLFVKNPRAMGKYTALVAPGSYTE